MAERALSQAQVEAVDAPTAAALEALSLLFAEAEPGDFAVRLWNGLTWSPAPLREARFTIVLRQPDTLRRMLLPPSEVAVAAAYVDGDCEVEGDLEAACEGMDEALRRPLGLGRRLRLASRLLALPRSTSVPTGHPQARLSGRAHSRQRDRQAITYHYDLSNAFYSLWLDRRMVYSCAYFDRPDCDLDAAQERKLDLVCRKLGLTSGQRLLDIGCGWGGLLLHAAQHYGVQALGITLSERQAALAAERIRAAGLAERCRVELRDYRDLDAGEGYDAIASIGMFEHVGREMLATYFAQAWRLLRPGGLFLNHAIALGGRARPDQGPSFANRYIFPDGHLERLGDSLRLAESTGFEVRDVECLREHYVWTLRHWRRRLEERQAEAVTEVGMATYRLWRLYLAAAVYGFRTNVLSVHQSLLARPLARSGEPATRRDWYLT